MDSQLKKGIMDGCVLAILKKGPSYGYKIITDLSQYIEISDSTLYPVLKRLESGGFVSTYNDIYNGRTRKYYKIEQPGTDKLDDFISQLEELKTVYKFITEA